MRGEEADSHTDARSGPCPRTCTACGPGAATGTDPRTPAIRGIPWLATAGSGDTLAGILGTVLAHVAEHPDALAGLGPWACGDGRWATAAALGAGLHALASRAHGEGPVPPSVLAENARTVLTRP